MNNINIALAEFFEVANVMLYLLSIKPVNQDMSVFVWHGCLDGVMLGQSLINHQIYSLYNINLPSRGVFHSKVACLLGC